MRVLYWPEPLWDGEIVLSDGPVGARSWLSGEKGPRKWYSPKVAKTHPSWVMLVVGRVVIQPTVKGFLAELKKALRALPKRCQDRGYLLTARSEVQRFPEGDEQLMCVHYLPTLTVSYGNEERRLDHLLGNTPKGYPDRISLTRK